jgi:hypothetical protein
VEDPVTTDQANWVEHVGHWANNIPLTSSERHLVELLRVAGCVDPRPLFGSYQAESWIILPRCRLCDTCVELTQLTGTPGDDLVAEPTSEAGGVEAHRVRRSVTNAQELDAISCGIVDPGSYTRRVNKDGVRVVDEPRPHDLNNWESDYEWQARAALVALHRIWYGPDAVGDPCE